MSNLNTVKHIEQTVQDKQALQVAERDAILKALIDAFNTCKTIVLFNQVNGRDKQTIVINSRFISAQAFIELLNTGTFSGRIL